MPALNPTNLVAEVLQLRGQGLPDGIIKQELQTRGYNPAQVDQALMQADSSAEPSYPTPAYGRAAPSSRPASDEQGSIYERMEEIAESIIDEKWEDLIAEVKKIVEWKETMEQRQMKAERDLQKLKDDFTLLHQGVLGRLDEYDGRMRDVGTELKAVGKVFKDVIPQFVENVKELKDVTGKLK